MNVVASKLGLPNFVYGRVNHSSPIPPLSIAPQNTQGRFDQFIPNATQNFSMMLIALVKPHYQGITQSYVPQYGVPQGASSSNPTGPTHFCPVWQANMGEDL